LTGITGWTPKKRWNTELLIRLLKNCSLLSLYIPGSRLLWLIFFIDLAKPLFFSGFIFII
jgi:hypothetical protein